MGVLGAGVAVVVGILIGLGRTGRMRVLLDGVAGMDAVVVDDQLI